MDTITATATPDPEDNGTSADLEAFAASYRPAYQTALCSTAVALRSAAAILPGR